MSFPKKIPVICVMNPPSFPSGSVTGIFRFFHPQIWWVSLTKYHLTVHGKSLSSLMSWDINLTQKMILLMAEILHHLVCEDPTNNGRSYLSTGAGFQPSTVSSCFFFLVAWKSHEITWNHPPKNRNRRKNRGMERWHGQYWCDVSSIIQHRGCSCITIALRWNSNAKTTMENPKKQPILKKCTFPAKQTCQWKIPKNMTTCSRLKYGHEF